LIYGLWMVSAVIEQWTEPNLNPYGNTGLADCAALDCLQVSGRFVRGLMVGSVRITRTVSSEGAGGVVSHGRYPAVPVRGYTCAALFWAVGRGITASGIAAQVGPDWLATAVHRSWDVEPPKACSDWYRCRE